MYVNFVQIGISLIVIPAILMISLKTHLVRNLERIMQYEADPLRPRLNILDRQQEIIPGKNVGFLPIRKCQKVSGGFQIAMMWDSELFVSMTRIKEIDTTGAI